MWLYENFSYRCLTKLVETGNPAFIVAEMWVLVCIGLAAFVTFRCRHDWHVPLHVRPAAGHHPHHLGEAPRPRSQSPNRQQMSVRDTTVQEARAWTSQSTLSHRPLFELETALHHSQQSGDSPPRGGNTEGCQFGIILHDLCH